MRTRANNPPVATRRIRLVSGLLCQRGLDLCLRAFARDESQGGIRLSDRPPGFNRNIELRDWAERWLSGLRRTPGKREYLNSTGGSNPPLSAIFILVTGSDSRGRLVICVNVSSGFAYLDRLQTDDRW